MARRLRTNRVDGWYHVFHRGIERRAIYADDRDREHFVGLLGEMHERFRVLIHAYSLMTNHWHGVLQTPDANQPQRSNAVAPPEPCGMVQRPTWTRRTAVTGALSRQAHRERGVGV